jgi:hypothetical protein
MKFFSNHGGVQIGKPCRVRCLGPLPGISRYGFPGRCVAALKRVMGMCILSGDLLRVAGSLAIDAGRPRNALWPDME